jgi:membrane protease YdiL (CAAX protease family)
VPWGFTNPPPVPPVIEAPGRFHRPHPIRGLTSFAGRAAPRRYLVGLLLGAPAALLLLAFEIASRGGFTFPHTPIAPWVIVEVVGVAGALGLILGSYAQAAQRRADGWRDFIGPSPFLLGAAQQATVLAMVLPVAALLGRLNVDTDSATGMLVLVFVYLASYFGLVHLLAVRTGALTWRDIFHPRHFAPDLEEWTEVRLATDRGLRPASSRLRAWLRGGFGDVVLAAALLIPVLIATDLANIALLAVLRLDPSQLQSDVPMHPTGIDRLMTFVSLAVLIPIGEEVFFRGYSTNAWGRSLSPASALFRAALFFAFIHVVNTDNTEILLSIRAAAFNFGARVPVALALCWVYMRRGSLMASASLHGFYNGMIVLIAFWATG